MNKFYSELFADSDLPLWHANKYKNHLVPTHSVTIPDSVPDMASLANLAQVLFNLQTTSKLVTTDIFVVFISFNETARFLSHTVMVCRARISGILCCLLQFVPWSNSTISQSVNPWVSEWVNVWVSRSVGRPYNQVRLVQPQTLYVRCIFLL
jgi:hypothetical protein